MKKTPVAISQSPDNRLSHAAIGLVIVCIVCVLAYVAGLGGGFLFDDYHDIVPNAALRSIGSADSHWLQLALSSNSGPLRRPLSMLSFGLNAYAFGMNPFFFKLVNLAIHLANGALIYAIGRRIASRLIPKGERASALPAEFLALLAAALWLLHPLNVSSVLYVVQRMNQLSTLFALCGLLCYVDGRIRLLRGETVLIPTLIALCLFGLLATFSKENGALTFAYALVIEATCFQFDAPRVVQQRILKGFFLIGVALPLTLLATYFLMHPDWPTHAYSNRNFTLAQRLLSETRILFHYLLWIFVPNPSWMGMFHDDIALSKNWFDPISTVPASLLLVTLIIASWKLRKTVPGFTFALAWFLVGHSMESTLLPLELVFEHRNYLPMAGLLLGTVCTLAPVMSRHLLPRAIYYGGAALLLTFSVVTATRATSWGSPLAMALDDARHHPDSSRTQYEAGREIIIAGALRGERDKAEKEAIAYFSRAAELDKTELAGSINLMLITASNGPVQPAAIADLAERL